MNKLMTVAEMRPLIDQALSSGGIFTFIPRGTSMMPLLREGVDSVELCPPDGIAIGDIALYQRTNGSYVLHRIVGEQDGAYVMCGDNQYKFEYGIKKEQIVAMVCALNRDGKHVERDDPELLKYVKNLPHRRRKKKIKTGLHTFLSKIKHKIIK